MSKDPNKIGEKESHLMKSVKKVISALIFSTIVTFVIIGIFYVANYIFNYILEQCYLGNWWPAIIGCILIMSVIVLSIEE